MTLQSTSDEHFHRKEWHAAGRLATRQWARGVTTTYAYNLRDQVTGMTYSDGTPAVTMSYDAAGRPLEIGNAVATDAYAYDDAGQLAVETQSVAGHPAAMRTLTHSHDADGLRTGLVYPGGKVLAAGYTARGQLATMTFHGQPVATSTYRPNGQPIGTVYGNGAQRTLSYDAAGRLTGTGTNVGAATITGRGYALDAVGRRTGYVDETAANAVFSYDPAGQVLGGTVPVPGQPASVNTYAYDPEGNRTQSSTGIQPAPADPVTITGSTTYTANPLNQYTAITGNPAPTYDADGNLLSGLRSPLSAFTCTWNGENRMLSSTSANVAITDRRVENAYDALGRRVRKTVKFASTGAVIEDRYFIYDGWNVIEETIAPATGPVETAEAVWGTDLSGTAQGAGGVGGLLLRESSATGASYYHYDGNGNVTALTSGAGTVQAAYTYGPFGETLRAVGPLAQANPWRFSTKYQDDETGLLYYGYRFYNPTDGRWPSRDPIGEEGGINLSGFVWNDAVGRYDAFGLSDAAVMSGSAAAGAALGGGASAVLSGIAAAIGDAIPPVAATIAIGAGTGIGSVGLADGLIDITAPPRRPRPVPIGKGSRTRPRAIPIPIADVDKWKGCPPCKPHSRGTLGYQAHPVPPSSKHGPWPCHHGHYYRVNQVPWPVCKCFWNEDVTAGTPWPGGGQDETFPITDINNPAGSAKPGSIYFGGPRSVFPGLTP